MYISTRGVKYRVTASKAILSGISPDGGLFVPEAFPEYGLVDIANLCDTDYKGRAKYILPAFLDDFTPDEIDYCVDQAYGKGKFPKEVAPIKAVTDKLWSLELWHGPTCAFKDMALQMLPHLMTVAMKKNNVDKKVLIVVATSGDTGKAALEGFKDVPDTKIITFFPEDGVSRVQKLQMTTQEGENIQVYGVYGNFDTIQSAVKRTFCDETVVYAVRDAGYEFSSANSINWGRLVPQIVYYFSAYCDLVNNGFISLGEKIDFAVPTGNFGDILAGYYAKKMGLPINKLICASNANKILTDFFASGRYSFNREFQTTISPSMDILVSSNLERLIYDLSDKNYEMVRTNFQLAGRHSTFKISKDIVAKINEHIISDYATDKETKQTIKRLYDEYGYLCDPHTAVAFSVYEKVGEKDVTTVVVSTADPFKFSFAVFSALSTEFVDNINEFQLIDKLGKLTHRKPPKQITGLIDKELRFKQKIAPAGVRNRIQAAVVPDNIV